MNAISQAPTDITCPFCDGRKEVGAFVNPGGWRMLRCPTCKGDGVVSPEHMARIEAGKKMRDERIARGETLIQAAQRLGRSPSDLSAEERGQ